MHYHIIHIEKENHIMLYKDRYCIANKFRGHPPPPAPTFRHIWKVYTTRELVCEAAYRA
jgi:hypothetical protein